MIVSRPSISTTGPASEVEQPEVGEQVVLLGRFELLEPVVAARLLEDVDGGLGGLAHGRSVGSGSRGGASTIRPVAAGAT